MHERTTNSSEPTVDCGVFGSAGFSCSYSIFQPAPTQWVAIGILTCEQDATPVMLVESGENADEAVAALKRRVALRAAQHLRRLASFVAA